MDAFVQAYYQFYSRNEWAYLLGRRREMPRVNMCKKVWRTRRHSPRCRHCFLPN